MSKTNIIIINPDEMRWDAMGHAGNAAARTPFLDSFATTEAVSFSNAYCQNPVCVPSRCSFLTGLYPHVLGHRTMNYLLREGETSLFQELKDAGYYVWMNARNDLVAGQHPGLAASHASEIYYGEKIKIDMAALAKSRVVGRNHGNTFPYSHFQGLSDGRSDNDMRDALAAIERITHPVDDRPLCLFLGWTNPHPPYQVEEPYFSAIHRDTPWPRISYRETSGKSRMIRNLRIASGLENYPEEDWTELRAVYLAQCNKVDTMFKMVCDALKQAGIYDNSAIFFLSDHGDFCGDYELAEKAQNSFENCLVKVPLLIKPPKGDSLDAGITGSLAELVDFYATALDYADITSNHDHFGKSLRPILGNRGATIRSFVCAEGGRMPYEAQCIEANVPGAFSGGAYAARQETEKDDLSHEKGTMIFDGHYKYIHRPSGENEFYDLGEDPGERKNLFDEMRHSPILLGLKDALLDWYQQTCDIVPKDYDNRFTAERVWASVQNFCPEALEPKVKTYIQEENPSIMEAIGYTMRLLEELQGKRS